ncbi:MAG: SagB/ThcOx family dehydrogenase [Pseudomonas sp.]
MQHESLKNAYISFGKNRDNVLEFSDFSSGRSFNVTPSFFIRPDHESRLAAVRNESTPATDTQLNPYSLLHWSDRGWEACIPFYLLSRTIKYVDDDKDRERILDNKYLEYESASVCPVPNVPVFIDRVQPVLELRNIVSTSLDWIPGFPEKTLRRRSHRQFKALPLEVEELLEILSHSVSRLLETLDMCRSLEGSRLKYTKNFGSAFSLYVVVYDVVGLKPGVYFLELEKQQFGLVAEGDFRAPMSRILWGMVAPKTANYTLVMTATPGCYAWRYRHDKALRNLFIEAGRIMHMHVNACSEFNVQGVTTPATRDDELRGLLSIDLNSDEIPMYTATMGKVGSKNAEA